MRILVTGAGGFIGGNLVERLRCDDAVEVTAVARRKPASTDARVRWLEADVSKADWTAKLADEPFDVVVHLAQSRHFRDFPERAPDIFDVNVKSTFELADWARRHGVQQFLFASTGNVYGTGAGVKDEESPCKPDSMYAASKLSAEILLKPFAQCMDVSALRLFGVYGPGQKNAMLPGIIQRVVTGAEITLAGNVGVRFNPIYVDDCTGVMRRIARREIELKAAQTLNIGGAEVVDLRRVVEILQLRTGQKARVRVTSDAPTELVGSTRRLAELDAGYSMTPFEEGFLRTLAANLSEKHA